MIFMRLSQFFIIYIYAQIKKIQLPLNNIFMYAASKEYCNVSEKYKSCDPNDATKRRTSEYS